MKRCTNVPVLAAASITFGIAASNLNFSRISNEGNLVLYNKGKENPVWSTNVSMEETDTSRVVAKLLDSGNLVLVDKRNNRTLWQSFEHPTNTLLPGMKLGLNKKTGLNSHLSSWRSPTDPATGNYSYRLNLGGSPQFLLQNGIKHYWRSHPWPWKRMPFPDIYYYDFINDGERIYSSYSVSHPSFITRIQLDESGNIRGLIWHQTDSDWKQFLISPTDRCDYHGRCGSYGKCDSYNINRFDCTCLPGYEPRFPRDWNLRDERGGCVKKRLDSSSICGNGEGFVKVESVKLPDTSKAVWIDMKMSEVDCELECRRNCSCSAYSSIAVNGGTSCLAWYGDLVDTKTNRADNGYDLYIRVDAIELDENVRRSKRMNRIPLIVSVASAWIIIFTVIYCCFKNKNVKWTRKIKRKRRMFDTTNGSDYLKDIFSTTNELDGGSSSHSDMVFFNFSTILAATDNFSSANKIGQGGFGIVYKGQLSNGQEIAVKRMSKSSGQGITEFKNEVMLISKLQHKNLVKLLGCCTKKEEQILVYEYLPNNSLDSFLFDEEKRQLLDWEKRLDIIVGIARGILYLHQDSRLTIIHRDLKSSNVLLDAKMNPKVSDFGMAKIFLGDQIQGMTNRVVGTYGYMSPEYAMFGKYSVKSDVFSFGVILLEVISGKKSQGFHQQENSMSLIGHVWELWTEGRVLEIIDSSLTESCSSGEALRCIQVGLLCVQEDAMERPTSSFSTNILTINQTFKDGDLLISQGKNFALGFFSPGSSKYRYLGIWFHKVSLQTVVWVANRNNPVNGSLGLLSVKEGNLVLYNNKSPFWSTNLSMGTNDTLKAKLLDSGNLVLTGRNNQILWQSFDYLTNTLIPGMKLGLNKKTGHNKFLSSWKSANDPGPGKYSYRLNPTGSPQIFLHNGTRPYWRTRPWPWKPFPDVVFIDFINNAEEIYHNFSVHDPSLITRVLLDDTGFLKAMIWNKNESEWKLFFTLPRDRCDYHGGCGPYGKCDSHAVNRFECICLPGYEPKSPQDWYARDGRGGCVRKRRDSMSICGNGEGFLKLESVKLPDALIARWIDMKMSRMECEMECKRNCSCSAYSSIENDGGTSCLAWYGDLIDITTYRADFGNDLYVRVDALELESVKRSNGMKRKPLIISVTSAWVVIIIIIVIYCWIRNKKKKGGKKNTTKRRMFDPKNEQESRTSSYPDMVFFDFSTMVAATDNFSSANRIGQGGFGTVYKGQLSNGQEIAVKRMSKSSKQGIEEFKNEVVLIAKLQHKNLVKLLGCCIEKKEQILIYEYLPNKSLDVFLFDESKKCLLDWQKRFEIIVGIARGILYLHQDSRLTIIHRDLKTSNVLLDEKMNPKISDFGMARMFQGDQTQVVTKRVVGTYGYMPPEYAMFGKFSVKSDVFSFGIILLEIISGKKSNGFHHQDASLSLAGHVWELWNEGRVSEIVDSSLDKSYNLDEALRCIQVGLLCVQEDDIERPTMLEVILMLKSETHLPCPKEPAFIFKTSSSNTKSLGDGEEGNCSINDLTLSAIVTR